MSDTPIIGIMLSNNPALIPLQFPDTAAQQEFIGDFYNTDLEIISTRLVNEEGVTMSARFNPAHIIAIFFDEAA